MKSTIIFLGLVALTFTNAKAANAFKSQDLDQQEFTTTNVADTQQQLAVVHHEMVSADLNTGTDIAIFDPSSVIKTTYVKTDEDIIAENKLITESQEESIQPLSLISTIEDRITEDNLIIESTVSNEMFALDFEKINHTVKCVKVHSNVIKNAALKL